MKPPLHIPKSALLALPALLVLLSSIAFVWNWRVDTAEGDVLIHLVFARNQAEGRANEYGLGQVSHAGTSPAWVRTLAWVSRLNGVARDPGDWFVLAQATSALFLAASLLALNAALRSAQAGQTERLAAVLYIACFPPVVYWCASNPMETAMATWAALLLLMLVHRVASGRLSPALLPPGAVAIYFVRPELLIFGLIAIPAAFIGTPKERRRRFVLHVVCASGLLAGLAGWVCAEGFSFIPNAASARRTALLHFDTKTLPLLNLRYNSDALMVFTILSPLLWGAVREVRTQAGARRSMAIHALGLCVFCLLFFSFYYPSTWRMRYLLPALFSLLPSGLAGLRSMSRAPVLRTLAPLYFLGISAITLLPLARISWTGLNRWDADLSPGRFWFPQPHHRTVLVQEVQGALFHPELRYISTDGLIGLEAVEAYKKGRSVLEFVLEQQPDLVGLGQYYLADPDGFMHAAQDAAQHRRDVRFGTLYLRYLGVLRGCGDVFEASYGGDSPKN